MLRTCPLKLFHIVLSLALILLFFHRIIFAENTFYFRDIHRWFYPMKFFLGEAFKAGSIPFWCPNYFCGAPFMSDIQSGVFYPLSVLFGLLPYPLSLNIFVLTHILLAILFFHLFIRSLGFSASAGLITSLSYAFGGYTLSSINVLNNLTTLVWLPAAMASFRWTLKSDFRKSFLFPVFFLCCAILGGEPQLFIFIAGVMILPGLISFDVQPLSLKIKASAIALFMVLISVGITTFQLGPMYTDYLHSVRLDGLPFEEAAKNSLPVASLQHLLLPLIFPSDFMTSPISLASFFTGGGQMPWLLTIYPGFIIVPLAITGLLGRQSRHPFYWLIIFCASLLLALGDNTPVYALFYKIVPIFRYPEKFIFICNICLLAMAAGGIDTIIHPLDNYKIRPLLITMLLAAILTADLFTSHRYLNPITGTGTYRHYHPDLEPIIKDPSIFRIFVDARPGPGPVKQQTMMDHHARWQLLMMPNLGLTHGIDQVGGKTGLELKYQYFITEILSKSWSEKLLFLKMANVKYIVSPHPLERDPDLAGHVRQKSPLVYQLEGNLPRAWLVGNVQAVSEGTLVDFLQTSYDPARSSLGSADLASRYNNPFFSPVDAIDYRTGSHLTFHVDNDRPSVLVLAESAYPGWRVYVDGVEKEVLWLNLFFQGVELDKGPHKIDFVFYPKNFYLFLLLSVISFFTLFIVRFAFVRSSKQAHPYHQGHPNEQ